MGSILTKSDMVEMVERAGLKRVNLPAAVGLDVYQKGVGLRRFFPFVSAVTKNVVFVELERPSPGEVLDKSRRVFDLVDTTLMGNAAEERAPNPYLEAAAGAMSAFAQLSHTPRSGTQRRHWTLTLLLCARVDEQVGRTLGGAQHSRPNRSGITLLYDCSAGAWLKPKVSMPEQCRALAYFGRLLSVR